MTGFEYDEDASAAWRMDVVYEVADQRPVPVSRWVEAMRRLNAINDPLARKILALHRDCGSGTGPCDDVEEGPVPIGDRRGWGCETTAVVAAHFSIEHPGADS